MESMHIVMESSAVSITKIYCTLMIIIIYHNYLFKKTAYKSFDLGVGVNQDCLKAKPLGWPCFFAPVWYSSYM